MFSGASSEKLPKSAMSSSDVGGCGECAYEDGGECQIEGMVEWEKDGCAVQSANVVKFQ